MVGQTNMMKLIISFRNFAKAPRNGKGKCSEIVYEFRRMEQTGNYVQRF